MTKKSVQWEMNANGRFDVRVFVEGVRPSTYFNVTKEEAREIVVYHFDHSLTKGEVLAETDEFAEFTFVMRKIYSDFAKEVRKVHQKILYSRFVLWAAEKVLSTQVKSIMELNEASKRTIRLYAVEGPLLSRKDEGERRLTWYSDPVTAADIGYHMHSTGRLVYVDLELSILSDYNRRYYKEGSEAYTLKGDLIQKSKNKWKYLRNQAAAEVAVTKE